MSENRPWRRVLPFGISAALACLAVNAGAQAGSSPGVERAIERLIADSQGEAVVDRSPSGLATFVVIPEGLPISAAPAASADARAMAFLRLYGEAFGLSESAEVRFVSALPRDEVGTEHVRYQQMSRGLPVTGAELIVHLRGAAVVGVNGRTLDDSELAAVATSPEISAEQAVGAARSVSTRRSPPEPTAPPEPLLELSQPRLELFDRGLLEGRASGTRLAWSLSGRADRVDERIWVDAASGAILLHFNQQPDAKDRAVYDSGNAPVLPGKLVRSEGQPATGDPDADSAYQFAGDFWDFLMRHFERDSIDRAGQRLVLSVHFDDLRDAFWDTAREQAAFGEAAARADDVVVHELAHGLTQHTANLYYYQQSGALGEAISDIFGETVDLVNRSGNDSAAVRWLAGEDWSGVGPARNMMDPGAMGSPGKTSDGALECFARDSGGVHKNNGILNHAYALAVDGGSYNGRQIQGVGLDKAIAIVYRALTSYLVSSSTFADADVALRRSCQDLIGVRGLQQNDCNQLGLALDAVEMSATWPCSLRANISGRVTNASGAPLRGVDVQVLDQAGTLLDYATTDATGFYVSNRGLVPGSYFARTESYTSYIDEVWNDIPCQPCSSTIGTPISITTGATRAGIDFVLAAGGRISGRVTDAAGMPIPDVGIVARNASNDLAGWGRTDSAGNYVTEGLPGGTYHAQTSNSYGLLNELWDDSCAGVEIGSGSCPLASGKPIPVVPGVTTPAIDFVLQHGGRISGTIVGDGGVPLADVLVHVVDSKGALRASGVTDSTGSYVTLGGLPAGDYQAHTWNHAGYIDEVWPNVTCRGGCAAQSGSPIAVAAGATTASIDFALELGGSIEGRVTRADTGAPMPSVGLEFFGEGGQQVGWSSSNAFGDYLGTGLPSGEYFVRAVPRGPWAEQVYRGMACGGCDVTTGIPVAVVAGSTAVGIDFALEPGGRITGRVTDAATGAPLDRATVFVHRRFGGRARKVLTDARGDYVADGLPEGAYTAYTHSDPRHVQLLYERVPFMYGAPPRAGGGTPLKVKAGADTADIDFALGSGGALAGRVHDDSTGLPLAGAMIGVFGPGGRVGSGTDAQGDYSRLAVPPGSYEVTAAGPEGQLPEYFDDAPSEVRATLVDVVDGRTRGGIDFALPPGGRVSGTIVDADTGSPLAKMAVHLFDRNGAWAAGATTDVSGAYTTAGVPTGRYHVRVLGRAGYKSQCLGGAPCARLEKGKFLMDRGKDLDVTAGSTAKGVDFALQAGGRIAGTICRAGTDVRLTGRVVVFDSEDHLVAGALAESDGSYVTDAGLEDGDYYVAAHAEGHVAELYGLGQAPFCTPGPSSPLWACPAAKGAPVSVKAGQITAHVDFELARGGAIAGTLRDGSTGGAVFSTVLAFDAHGLLAGAASSDVAGGYRLEGLPAGSYYLRSFNSAGYIDVTNGGTACGLDCVPWAAKPVTVVAGSVTADVDFDMRRGGRISGRVTDATTRDGYSGMEMVVYDATGVRVAAGVTDREGAYRTQSTLPDGVYYVEAKSRSTYPSMLFGGAACAPGCDPRSGKPITVSGGADVDSIDLVVGP